jgi:hypothetical protein
MLIEGIDDEPNQQQEANQNWNSNY